MVQDETGHLQIQQPKCKLMLLWENYRDIRAHYLLAKHAYEEERNQTKFLKTPKNSEDGDTENKID